MCDTPDRSIAEHSVYQRQGVGDKWMGSGRGHYACVHAVPPPYMISLGTTGESVGKFGLISQPVASV